MRMICEECAISEGTERSGWLWCRAMGQLVRKKQACVLGFYECDPEKNVACNKRACYLNGGDCYMTRRKEYAKHDTQGSD